MVTKLRQDLDDIYGVVSWLDMSRTYFNRSAAWLYHRINGIDKNGLEVHLTEEETATLKHALVDLAERIKVCAEKIS